MSTQKFCAGYCIEHTNENGEQVETLFAICEDGKILESFPRQYKNSFTIGRTWKKSTLNAHEVQGRATFIGRYPQPTIGTTK